MKGEKYVIGFRTAAGKMCYITEAQMRKDGSTLYVYGTQIKKKALRFSREEAENVMKTTAQDTEMMQVSD